MEARSYDFSLDAPFVFSDIIDIFPIVKHMSPKVCLASASTSLPLPLLFVLLAEIKIERGWTRTSGCREIDAHSRPSWYPRNKREKKSRDAMVVLHSTKFLYDFTKLYADNG